MSAPALEAEVGTTEARGDIERHHGCLDGQCSAATHRIDERGAFGKRVGPARARKHGGCDVFLQWSCNRKLAIGSSMQSGASEINAYRGFVALDVDVDAHVGLVELNARTLAEALAHLVDDGILHPLGAKMRMVNGGGDRGVIYGKRGARGQVRCPVDAPHAVVELVGVGRGKGGQAQEDAAGEPRPQTGPITGFEGSGEGHASAGSLGVRGSHVDEFLFDEVIHRPWGGGEEAVFGMIFHGAAL